MSGGISRSGDGEEHAVEASVHDAVQIQGNEDEDEDEDDNEEDDDDDNDDEGNGLTPWRRLRSTLLPVPSPIQQHLQLHNGDMLQADIRHTGLLILTSQCWDNDLTRQVYEKVRDVFCSIERHNCGWW